MSIEKQIEALKTHFDTDLITNKSTVKKLTPTEYTNIKVKIKSEKTDGVHAISGRVYIQLINQEVFIFDCNANE